MAQSLLSKLYESSRGPGGSASHIALAPGPIEIRELKRSATMLRPLWLISKQALLGVVFLFGVMLLCAALLTPVAMCALVNVRY